MNTDLIRDDFPLVPLGLIETDAIALTTYITMYSLAVENLDDVKVATGKIDEARKSYFDYYETHGQPDEFKKAVNEEEKDEKHQIAVNHLKKVFQRESSPVEIKPIEVTGDIEKDAHASIEGYIKLMDGVSDFTDMMYLEKDMGALLGAIMSHYDEACPDFQAFNDASEHIAAELDMEGHMKAFQERTEAFQALFQ